MKCPQCGYIHPKKAIGKPKRFTKEEEKLIIQDRQSMTLKGLANKYNCAIGTIQNILKNYD